MTTDTEIVYEGRTIKVRLVTKVRDRRGATHYYQDTRTGQNYAQVGGELYQWDTWTHLSRQAGFTDADWAHQAVAEAMSPVTDHPAFAEFGKRVSFH